MTIAICTALDFSGKCAEEIGSFNFSYFKQRKALQRMCMESMGDERITKILGRHIQTLSLAYEKSSTNKLKNRFRCAIRNDDHIALCSLSLALSNKQILSFNPYDQGVLNEEGIKWMRTLGYFLEQTKDLSPGDEEWRRLIKPLLENYPNCLSATLQLVRDLHWYDYLMGWPPYDEAVEAEIHNLHGHDPRLTFLANWTYEVPVYLD